ncbi:daptide-type RiPP [Streptomyces azureus]|jgi:hypothetical protein|uniref:Uncharacterized protein n=1 Tax=Streptomyces azureus TaxID=146537 RepID=A0A0K8PPA0_STRAJ|nr:daptide-type RiPP [Streptomyces azureus]GAP49697.1 uncharacterized protein SAZU_4560 [Streptomyces azureus]
MSTDLDLQFEELETLDALWNWAEFGSGFGAGATAFSVGVAVFLT